jgi:hypothetical protein
VNLPDRQEIVLVVVGLSNMKAALNKSGEWSPDHRDWLIHCLFDSRPRLSSCVPSKSSTPCLRPSSVAALV